MRIVLLLSLILIAFSAQSFTLSQPLEPFKAFYTAEYNGRSLSGSRELTVKKGQWQLNSTFKTLFVSIHESSQGNITSDLELDVSRYDYHRKIFGIKKKQSRVFNQQTNSVDFDDGKNAGSYTFSKDTFDTASQEIYIREMLMRGETNFTMPLAGRTNLKYSTFAVSETELLELPMGKTKAIRVDRIASEPNGKQVTIWFSPEMDYQMVKFRQVEKDGKHYEMMLAKLNKSI